MNWVSSIHLHRASVGAGVRFQITSIKLFFPISKLKEIICFFFRQQVIFKLTWKKSIERESQPATKEKKQKALRINSSIQNDGFFESVLAVAEAAGWFDGGD